MKIIFKNTYNTLKILSVILSILLISSCITNKVPKDKYLLVKNKFKVHGDKSFDSELPSLVSQKRNRRIFGVLPIGLMVYNSVNKKYDSIFTDYKKLSPSYQNQKSLDSLYSLYHMPEEIGKKKGWQRFWFNLGQPPVIIDTALSHKSANNIENYYIKHGFYDATTDFLIKTIGKKKAVNIFNITTNAPTIIKSLDYSIPYENIMALYNDNIKRTLIKSGDRLDEFIMEKEIGRFEKIMQNDGYFAFNLYGDEMYFLADSIHQYNKDKNIPVKLEIIKSNIDSASSNEFKQFTYQNINVNMKINRPLIDTLYEGYRLKIPSKLYKERVYADMMAIEPNDIYRADQIALTKKNIYKSNNFNLVDFKINKLSDSLLGVNIVLGVKKKYDLSLSLEGSYNSLLKFGFSPGLTFTQRNVFGGAENFTLSTNGTLGTVSDPTSTKRDFFNAYEIGFQAGITFPRWFVPLNKLLPKRYSPSSTINLGASWQQNIGLGRVNYYFNTNFFVNPNLYVTHSLSLANLQFTKFLQTARYFDVFQSDASTRNEFFNAYFEFDSTYEDQWNNGQISWTDMTSIIYADDEYMDDLILNNNDLYLSFQKMYDNYVRNTQNQFITSLNYNFNYNELNDEDVDNPFYFNGNIELAGNILKLADDVFGFKKVVDLDEERGELFGIPYAQYAKFEIDVRKYWRIGYKSKLVTRLLMGYLLPYGNSNINNMPLIKAYFAGGSNDVRAWRAFELGPADSDNLNISSFSVANFKITSNIEYRFPVTGDLESAVFIDVGNIWNMGKDTYDKFIFGEFYKQLGIGSGVGLRYNLSFIIMRLDIAYQFYNPILPLGQRWNFNHIEWFKPTINFAIGYPF